MPKTPERATRSPLVSGTINQDTGAAGACPELTVADKVAVDFINTELNGVDGHPIKLRTCNTNFNADSKPLPGYYADATIQFDLTERAGFYAGAVFQSAGSYNQNIDTVTNHYSTKIDHANQNGVRAGLSIRF